MRLTLSALLLTALLGCGDKDPEETSAGADGADGTDGTADGADGTADGADGTADGADGTSTGVTPEAGAWTGDAGTVTEDTCDSGIEAEPIFTPESSDSGDPGPQTATLTMVDDTTFKLELPRAVEYNSLRCTVEPATGAFACDPYTETLPLGADSEITGTWSATGTFTSPTSGSLQRVVTLTCTAGDCGEVPLALPCSQTAVYAMSHERADPGPWRRPHAGPYRARAAPAAARHDAGVLPVHGWNARDRALGSSKPSRTRRGGLRRGPSVGG
jgi:hypothetical protein